jgi:CDP-glycerol glycerophosphotransferase (TagB/SpsB family)
MDESIRKRYKKLESNNFCVVDELNILPFMAGSDIMITDTSSVAYEFLSFDRPLITYKAIARKYKGINIQHPSELSPAIERSLNDPNEFSHNRESCLQDIHPYSDGNSSNRVLKGIADILANGLQNDLKQKPQNFIRKYQIRKIIAKSQVL